jgi:hypothetical protein
MRFVVSPELYEGLMRGTIPAGAVGGWASLLACPITVSVMFPFDVACDPCSGTGADAADGAYCSACRGRGRTRHLGSVLGRGTMAPIVAQLPALFAPRFPRGLVSPRKPVKIVL